MDHRQLNVAQFVVQTERRTLTQPDITRVRAPATWLQRLAAWAGRRSGLFEPHTPTEQAIEYVAVRLEGSDRERIARTVIGFINTYGDQPADLVILLGSDKYAALLRGATSNLYADIEFGNINGFGRRTTYHGVEIKLVSYIDGPLVLRRRDLR